MKGVYTKFIETGASFQHHGVEAFYDRTRDQFVTEAPINSDSDESSEEDEPMIINDVNSSDENV